MKKWEHLCDKRNAPAIIGKGISLSTYTKKKKITKATVQTASPRTLSSELPDLTLLLLTPLVALWAVPQTNLPGTNLALANFSLLTALLRNRWFYSGKLQKPLETH